VTSASLIGVFWWFGRRCSFHYSEVESSTPFESRSTCTILHASSHRRHYSLFSNFLIGVVIEWMRAFAESFNELANGCIWGHWATQGWHLSPVSWRTEGHPGDLLMLGGNENNGGELWTDDGLWACFTKPAPYIASSLCLIWFAVVMEVMASTAKSKECPPNHLT
jgi:hypothetical protein